MYTYIITFSFQFFLIQSIQLDLEGENKAIRSGSP
jgi:hypothetical protein